MKLILGLNHLELEDWLEKQLGAKIIDRCQLVRDVTKVSQHIQSDFVVVGDWLPDATFIPSFIHEHNDTNLVIIVTTNQTDGEQAALCKEILTEAAAKDIYNIVEVNEDGNIDMDALVSILMGHPRSYEDIKGLLSRFGLLVAKKPSVPVNGTSETNRIYGAAGHSALDEIAVYQVRDSAEEVHKPVEVKAERKPGLVLTGSGFKGGIGKTTVVANTAVALAKRGKKVIAIDLNFGTPALGSHFGIGYLDKQRKPILGIGYFLNVPVEEVPSIESLCIQSNGIYVLPGAPTSIRTSRSLSEDDIVQLIDRAREEFDVVLLDTEQAIDDLGTLDALIEANKIMFVVDQDRAALREIKTMLDEAKKFNLADKFELVLNSYRKPDTAFPSKKEIEEFLGLKTTLLIKHDDELMRASNVGELYSFEGENKEAWERFIDYLTGESHEETAVSGFIKGKRITPRKKSAAVSVDIQPKKPFWKKLLG